MGGRYHCAAQQLRVSCTVWCACGVLVSQPPVCLCLAPHDALCCAVVVWGCLRLCVCVAKCFVCDPNTCVFGSQERGVGGGFLVLTLLHVSTPGRVSTSLYMHPFSHLPCVRHTALLLHSISTLAGASACCQPHMGSGWEGCLMAACRAGWQVGCSFYPVVQQQQRARLRYNLPNSTAGCCPLLWVTARGLLCHGALDLHICAKIVVSNSLGGLLLTAAGVSLLCC